jgi:triphosphoribosyl-dephospho-CoA synthase
VLGARRELQLTPKPGLVDRRDSGSHPDLSYGRMAASVRLLPEYYADLLRRLRAGRTLVSCIEAGRDAEARMLARVGTNAHRGYIFLSGLTLVALHRSGGRRQELRAALGDAASEFFAGRPRYDSNGSRACRGFGVGGIRAEAEAGLPAVFEEAWPRYAAGVAREGSRRRAAYQAMAALMQHVEDTTALHRCGPRGLARVRRDGAVLEALLAQDRDPQEFLQDCNEAYRRRGLTMGGVADCLALTIALETCFGCSPAEQRTAAGS